MSDLNSEPLLVTIGGRAVDVSDPCALCRALTAYRMQVATGGAVEELEIRSPVTSRRTKFSGGAKPDDLDRMIETARAACQALLGEAPKRRRFATSGRNTRPY